MMASTREPADYYEEFIEGAAAVVPPGPDDAEEPDTPDRPGPSRWRSFLPLAAVIGVLAATASVAMVAVLIVGSLGDTGEEVQPSTELSSAAAVTTRGDVGSATTAEPEAVTTEPAAVDDTIEPAAPVAVSVEGGQVILEGVVESEDLRHSFFVAVSQLTGDETTVDNRLRVEPGAGARLEISLRVADSVLFELGSADISEEFAALLDQVASVLDLVPEARVQVGGHTDLSGSDEVNQVLSTARATAVVDYLVAEGVSPERLEAVGYGSSRPVADNATPEGRRANRRIEIDLIT